MNDIPNSHDTVQEEPSAEAIEYAKSHLLDYLIGSGYTDQAIEEAAASIPDDHPNKYVLVDQYLEYYMQNNPEADIEEVRARLAHKPQE